MSNATELAVQPLMVASYVDAQGRQFLPLSQAEHDRRTWFYRRVIDSFDLPARQNVLIISDYNDHALTIPLQAVLHGDGHIPCYAESTWFDARRTENFLRRMEIRFVVGVNSALLDGLEAAGFTPAELFAGRTVFARDEAAYQRLGASAGITLRRWRDIGPALAMECRHGGGLHIDPSEWHTEVVDGELVLSSRLRTCIAFDRVATGVNVRQVDDLCDCGRDGPRFLPLG